MSTQPPSPHLPWRYRLFRLFLQASARILFETHVVGKENIPNGNYVVVANHLSWSDPFLLTAILPAEPRLYFIGAQQAINRGWKAWLMRRYDAFIPFERGAMWMGKEILTRPLQVLESGAALGLFPEGVLGTREGELQPLQRGIGHIVLHADYPILPVALSGVQELYLKKRITVTIGKAFHVAKGNVVAGRAAVDSAIEQVTRALCALIPQYVEPNAGRKRMRFLTNLLG